MSMTFNLVVMAGGVGSRLWPLSRASFPKQFQCLVNPNSGLSMLQQTLARLENLHIVHGQVICNQDHRFLAAGQVQSLGLGFAMDLVLEPIGRNTAPAVLVAALRLQALGNDEPMLLLAADHAIADVPAFVSALAKAHALACLGWIVTLGIEPTFACTGYGYIKRVEAINDDGYAVASFVEKPTEKVAKGYVDSGGYDWNSGMFITRPSVLLAEAAKLCPELLAQCERVVAASFADLDFVRLPENEFAACQDVSIDYAIMEHTAKAAVVPMRCGWSDVGDLSVLKQANACDEQGNVLIGDVETIDSSHCLVHASSKLVAILGVHNIAVIETKDAVLVTDLSQAQQVKKLVKRLQSREETDHHREVYRPWGSYDSVDCGVNYQVKRITVNPGQRLSLQRHQHRAEHWVVVEGTALVQLDYKQHRLTPNQSIYIPKMATHSLANDSDEPLHLIEVQSGDYLGEDDIERLEDVYGRAEVYCRE